MDKENDIKLEKLRQQKRKYKKSRKKIEVLYTLSEYTFLTEQGKRFGCSTTAYVKITSLKKTSLLLREPKSDIETVAQIRKIGVNVNQIAKQVNSLKDSLPNSEEIMKGLDVQLKALHDIISKILSK